MSNMNTEKAMRPFEDDLAALLAALSGYGSFVHEMIGDAGEGLWAGTERPGPDSPFRKLSLTW